MVPSWLGTPSAVTSVKTNSMNESIIVPLNAKSKANVVFIMDSNQLR